MVTFDGAAAGTPEARWRAARVREAAPPLDAGAVTRLVVLAAHPDDESLMAAGLLHAVAASGREVVVVVATLGEASHPRSPTTTPAALAETRDREVRAAVACVAPSAEVVLLELPDGGLDREPARLVAALEPHVRAGDTVVAPWRGDGHPDHEALGAAAAELAHAAGAVLLEAPIWAWHWGDPDAPGWPSAVRFDLTEADRAAKDAALAAHPSQTRPLSDASGDEAVLSASMIEHFGGDELFFPSGVVAVDFDAMYAAADDPWGFEDRWYEQRKRAVTLASLPAQRYRRALEIGCSIGVLADALADRVDSLLATDAAPRAIEQARERLAQKPWVRVERRRMPDEWPKGVFDLVVLSETGFYLHASELDDVADRIGASLPVGGTVLLCHWRPHVVGLELSGDEVHRVLRERLGLAVTVEHVEADFRLEVLQSPPARSVAQATGLR